MLSCNCLNVVFETENDDFHKVTSASLELTEEESNDEFFQQDFKKVGKLKSINKVLSSLVETRTVGSWIINYCINCDVHTHALHKERGASCVLVNSKLISEDEIVNLKKSDLFSQTYKIVVRISDLDDRHQSHVDTYVPKETQDFVNEISDTAMETIKKESLEVEERIKKYTEQQYIILDNFKDKTLKEKESLMRLLISRAHKKTEVPDRVSRNSHPSTPTKLESPRSFNFKSAGDYSKGSARHTPQRQRSKVEMKGAVESEMVFEFDGIGIDGVHISQSASEEESDADVEDGVSREPRIRASRLSLAKSLPVNIPIYMSQYRDREDSDKLPSEENIDIAASIRALAQSVHSDAIFGDLPRPRFSTQI